MTRLLPCPSCRRHVNNADERCPFCAAAMPTQQTRASPSLPLGRLSRIAVLTAGATLAASATGCGESTKKTDAGTGGLADGGGHGGAGGSGGVEATGGSSAGGTAAPDAGTGGSVDAGPVYDGPIAIYSAAIAVRSNKT